MCVCDDDYDDDDNDDDDDDDDEPGRARLADRSMEGNVT